MEERDIDEPHCLGKGQGALKNRANLVGPSALAMSQMGSLDEMAKSKVRIGFFYASMGALSTCIALPLLGVVSIRPLIPALVYLSLATIGFWVMSRYNLSIGLGLRLGTKRKSSVPPPKILNVIAHGERDLAVLGHEIKNHICTLKGNSKLLRIRGASVENTVILDRIDRVVEKLEMFSKDIGATASAGAWAKAPALACSQVKPLGIIAEPHVHTSLVKAKIRRPIQLVVLARVCAKTHFHTKLKRFHWDAQVKSDYGLNDADSLEPVFLNLYRNALEAAALNIVTRFKTDGPRLLATIEDDGKGCHPHEVDRLFEPFYTTKAGEERRGLGLFIVRSIVEGYGGNIRVQSKNKPSAGTHGLIFTLELPLSQTNRTSAPDLSRGFFNRRNFQSQFTSPAQAK